MLEYQYQIQGDRIGREGQKAINIGMEIKTTYRQGLREVIVDKSDYKQRHYHDYSVIITDIDVMRNTQCNAKQMIIDIYAQATKKQEIQQPTHQNRFIFFMIQHHPTRITKIIKDAGLPVQQINMAFAHFDEKAAQHFTTPNHYIDYEQKAEKNEKHYNWQQEKEDFRAKWKKKNKKTNLTDTTPATNQAQRRERQRA
eukprot:5173140-Amphidinium_carterae.3